MDDSKASRRNSGIVAVGTAASRGLGLVTTLLIAALLAPDQVGVFAFGQSSAALLAGLGGLALPAIVTRDAAQGQTDRQHVFRAGLALLTLGTTVFCVLGFAAAQVFDDHLIPDGVAGKALPAFGLGIALSALGQGVNGLTIAAVLSRKQFRTLAVLSTLRACALLIGATAGALSKSAAVLMLAVGVAEMASAVGASLYTRVWRASQAAARGLRTEMFRLLRLSWAPGAASQVVQLCNWALLVLLTRQPDGLSHAGYLYITVRVVAGVAFLPTSVVTAQTPAIHERAVTGGLRNTVVRALRDSVLVGTVLAVVVIMGAYLLPLLGEGYESAIPTMQISALILPLTPINLLLGTIALAWHREGIWAASDIVLGMVSLAAGLLLVPPPLSEGTAAAGLLGMSATVAFLAVALYRKRGKVASQAYTT